MNIDDLVIKEDISVFEAMKRLEETGRKILFVAPEGILKAVLTDSDIRKFILRGGDLTRPAAETANYTPKTLPVEKRSEAKDFLQRHSIDAVPLLGKQGAIADVVFLNDFESVSSNRQLDIPVVIMAGGLGTRLYPYTKILPKPLIPIGENPIVELIIEKFYGFGCNRFHLIVNYKKNMIKSYFMDIEKEYDIQYVDEDIPLGTGGGLCLLKGQIEETFFLTNCDILIDADYTDILKFHKEEGNAVTMVCAMKHFTIPYGVVEMTEDGGLKKISEKPELNMLTNAGMYIVEPAVLEQIEDGVRQGFTDIMEQCMQRGQRVGVYPVSDGSWMDMGQMEELEKMRRRMEQGS